MDINTHIIHRNFFYAFCYIKFNAIRTDITFNFCYIIIYITFVIIRCIHGWIGKLNYLCICWFGPGALLYGVLPRCFRQEQEEWHSLWCLAQILREAHFSSPEILKINKLRKTRFFFFTVMKMSWRGVARIRALHRSFITIFIDENFLDADFGLSLRFDVGIRWTRACWIDVHYVFCNGKIRDQTGNDRQPCFADKLRRTSDDFCWFLKNGWGEVFDLFELILKDFILFIEEKRSIPCSWICESPSAWKCDRPSWDFGTFARRVDA